MVQDTPGADDAYKQLVPPFRCLCILHRQDCFLILAITIVSEEWGMVPSLEGGSVWSGSVWDAQPHPGCDLTLWHDGR